MKASLVEPPPGVACTDEPRPASRAVIGIREARGFFARARGLLGRPVLASGCGLLLRDVRTVHSFGMRHAIDLVFLDERFVVVRCARLATWRIAHCTGARHVLEMAEGEARRLALRPGARPILLAASAIFRRDGDSLPPFARTASGSSPRTLKSLLPLPLLAMLALLPVATSVAEEVLDQQVLRRLHGEADLLYRDSAAHAADEELLSLYQSLAAAAPRRAYHAWLRVGNIHQRAGALGAAIDAYRLALQSDAAGPALEADEEDARRKALLNLAALALDQAHQALAILSSLPTAAVPVEQLRSLQQQYEAENARLNRGVAEGAGPADAQTPAGNPQFIERYTASGRRNAVKSARGSLHLHPADDLPAKPLPKPRSRHGRDKLPDVEYLLGDPQRFAPAADAHAPDGKRRKTKAAGGKEAAGRADRSVGDRALGDGR